jgi:hypothetical protein
MEEFVVDLHVLIVNGAIEGNCDHHRKLAQLQLTALHACVKTDDSAKTTL